MMTVLSKRLETKGFKKKKTIVSFRVNNARKKRFINITHCSFGKTVFVLDKRIYIFYACLTHLK